MAKKKAAPKKKKSTVPKLDGKGSLNRPHPNRLRDLRLRGTILSQEQIAKLMDIDSSTVSRDEAGLIPMSRDRIQAYAMIYRVPSYEIFLPPQEQQVNVQMEGPIHGDKVLPPDFQVEGGDADRG